MDTDHSYITASAKETARVGEELGNYLKKVHSAKYTVHSWGKKNVATVVCLYGELGSGKTTFVQGFAKGIGITTRLLSPTFIIVRRYSVPQRAGFLYHIDLFRIEAENDLHGLGLEEILADPDSIVLVEWAEKLGRLLPKGRIDVQFSVLEDRKHLVSLSSSGLTRGSSSK